MGLFNKRYICNRCGRVFDESEANWVDIDSSGSDTVDSEDVMDTIPLCPYCGSDYISEYYGDDNNSNVGNKRGKVKRDPMDSFESVVGYLFIAGAVIGVGVLIYGSLKAFLAFVVVFGFLMFLTK